MLFNHKPWDVMHGVAICLLAALGFVMAFGLRYPVRMLPILLFEFLSKTIWTVAIGIPLWRAGQIDADTMETAKACVFGAIFCIGVIPWGFVWRHYVRKPGDRWRGPARIAK